MKVRELVDLQECDLVMKGGLTSGVVYPYTISEIAKKYRLRSIGGTSAGAIGSVFAAAAEYSRQNGSGFTGFEKINSLADELAEKMASMFQPYPQLTPLFKLLEAKMAGAGKTRLLLTAISAYFPRTFWFFLLATTIAFFVSWQGSLLEASLTITLLILLYLGTVAYQIFKSLKVDLMAADYGICPGLTQKGYNSPAFTNWIADEIDKIAKNFDGSGKLNSPLTIGQLKASGIEIASITTDISSSRPYQLPLLTKNYYFSKNEFERILPDRIVQYLTQTGSRKRHNDPDVPNDLYKLPSGDEFPVLLVARMSLSFPGLISAVPLYRIDNGLKQKSGGKKIMRCLFSDGGLASNFPIHFFDNLLPSRPTFGITLSSYHEERHGKQRVVFNSNPPNAGNLPPVHTPQSLFSFLFAIINTAKDWQDTLQARMPGYAERIVEIRLDGATEGGFNLDMDKDTIKRIQSYGRLAGIALVCGFDFEEHRYRRALSVLPKLEGAFEAIDNAMKAGKADYGTLLVELESASYKNSKSWRIRTLRPFVNALAKKGQWKVRKSANLPHVDARIRLVADADRVPK